MEPTQDVFLSDLFHQYFQRLYLYANAIVQNPAEAQDLVQDTFHVAVGRIDVLIAHENPGGWLFQTLKHKIQENERKKQQYLAHILPLLPSIVEALPDPNRLEDEVLRRCDVSLTDRLKAALTPEEWNLLNQFFLEGKSHKQLADALGISIWASQKRIERIRKKLFAVFPEYHGRK